jgi:hypothetical protein
LVCRVANAMRPYLERNIARERKVNFGLILVKNGLERIQSEARIGI